MKLCIVYLSLFYVLATSKFISGQIPSCESVHSWQLYRAAPLGNQAISIMTIRQIILTLSQTVHIPIMPSTCLGSDTYQFYKSMVWLVHGFKPVISHTQDQCSSDSVTMPIGIPQTCISGEFYSLQFSATACLTHWKIHLKIWQIHLKWLTLHSSMILSCYLRLILIINHTFDWSNYDLKWLILEIIELQRCTINFGVLIKSLMAIGSISNMFHYMFILLNLTLPSV